jgi:hypothetical protein
LSLKDPGKEPPTWFPNGVPMDRDVLSYSLHMFNSFIHGERNMSPSAESHADEGLHTVGCGLVPQGDCFGHSCSLPQCHAAFGMIPSPPWLG